MTLLDYRLNDVRQPPAHWITRFSAEGFRERQQRRKCQHRDAREQELRDHYRQRH